MTTTDGSSANGSPAAGVAYRRVSLRGDAFEVEVFERGRGPTLLVLHDLAARYAWADFMTALSNDFHVLSIRVPGWGYSSGGDHLDDPVDVAMFLDDFLDELGVRSALVLGHDLGGMFATELAALNPNRVEKLVLVSPLGLTSPEADIADISAIDPARIPGLLWHDPTGEAARDFDAPASEQMDVEEQTILRARAYATASKYTWPFPERGLWKRVHRVRQPTLLIWGESDGYTPAAMAKPFATALANLRLETIAEAGHFPMIERPAQFVEAVAGFLKSKPKRRG